MKIDSIDRRIVDAMQEDARRSLQVLARKMGIAPGTVHLRYQKLRESGIILGTTLRMGRSALGYGVCAFVGVNLNRAGDYKPVLQVLERMPEILEAHYTTGSYNILLKVVTRNVRDLHDFLIERLQAIPQVQTTETFISLEQALERDLPLPGGERV